MNNNIDPIFPCRYPILSVPMNQVSDLKLALAVSKAGGFPSLSIFNYFYKGSLINWPKLEQDLTTFKEFTGHCKIVLSVDTHFMCADNPKIIEIIDKFKISHIEIIGLYIHLSNPYIRKNIVRCSKIIKNLGAHIFIKVVRYTEDLDEFLLLGTEPVLFDSIELKGANGAGRIDNRTNKSLIELIGHVQKNYPTLPIIATGGISSSDDVSNLLNNGAAAVGIGTLLAVSEESCISKEAKVKMIEANSNSLTKIVADNNVNTLQSALVFKQYTGPDSGNNTVSLRNGVQTGTEGHVFAGKGIDSIKEILPVKDIIERLFDGVSLPY